jgi:membrane protease YdiL (CAAX protease family)
VLWLVAGGVLGIWALHNGLLLPWELRHLRSVVREPGLVVVRVLLWLCPALFYLKQYDARPRLEALGVTSALNRRGLAWSGLASVVYLAWVAWLLLAMRPPGQPAAGFGALASISAVYMLLTVLLEELLMRGFLLGQLVRFLGSFWAQAWVALLFALMHVPGWLALDGWSWFLLPSFLSLTLLGALLGGVYRASNSLWPAIALHLANNVLADVLGGS